MSTPVNAMITGSFVSNGSALSISLPSQYDQFEVVNISDAGSAAANTNIMRAKGYSTLPAGYAYLNTKTSGAATLALESMITTQGFTFVPDSGIQGSSTAAITAITAASPAVVSSASGAQVGDIVRITGSTGMLQIAGYDFSVTATNPGVTQTLGYLPAVGFAAAATAGTITDLVYDPRYYPRRRLITAITAASSAVITLSVTSGFIVGEQVRIYVPSAFGMTQMNNQLATITAVNTSTNTITVNINSSSFSAFAFPTSATAALGVTPAQVVPVGEAATAPYQNLLDDATRNLSFTGVVVGTGVQTSGSTYQWIARRGLQF